MTKLNNYNIRRHNLYYYDSFLHNIIITIIIIIATIPDKSSSFTIISSLSSSSSYLTRTARHYRYRFHSIPPSFTTTTAIAASSDIDGNNSNKQDETTTDDTTNNNDETNDKLIDGSNDDDIILLEDMIIDDNDNNNDKPITNDNDTTIQTTTNTENDTPTPPQTTTTTKKMNPTQQPLPIGIGGRDGFVYDVNKIKRNYVQEVVREYKRDLLNLLSRSYDFKSLQDDDENDDMLELMIDDKLAHLVEVNPVSTTTDSNLIDGRWYFVYASNDARQALDTTRLERRQQLLKRLQKDQRLAAGPTTNTTTMTTLRRLSAMNTSSSPLPPPPSRRRRRRSHYIENPFMTTTRTFQLETTTTTTTSTSDTTTSTEPSLIDEISILGGYLTLATPHLITKLTRRKLYVSRNALQLCLGRRWSLSLKRPVEEREVDVKYLDGDLCIVQMTKESSADDLVVGRREVRQTPSLAVYTKNDVWIETTERRRRKTAYLRSILLSPLRFLQRLLSRRRRQSPTDYQYANTSIAPTPTSSSSFYIGEVDNNGIFKDESLNVEDDPFYGSQLDDENMKKNMSVSDLRHVRELERQRRDKEYKTRKKLRKTGW